VAQEFRNDTQESPRRLPERVKKGLGLIRLGAVHQHPPGAAIPDGMSLFHDGVGVRQLGLAAGQDQHPLIGGGGQGQIGGPLTAVHQQPFR